METPLFVALTRFDLVQVAAVYGAVCFTIHAVKLTLWTKRLIDRRQQPKAQPRPRAERL